MGGHRARCVSQRRLGDRSRRPRPCAVAGARVASMTLEQVAERDRRLMACAQRRPRSARSAPSTGW
jgi:hypothetical protein